MADASVDDEPFVTRPHRFRLDDLVDTWMLRAGLLAWAVGLVTATWSSGSVPRWFCGVASATALVATLPPLGPIGIRRVRFAAGATTASAGAVLTLQLGFMLQRPEAEDPPRFQRRYGSRAPHRGARRVDRGRTPRAHGKG